MSAGQERLAATMSPQTLSLLAAQVFITKGEVRHETYDMMQQRTK